MPISCADCGTELSAESTTCPQCGSRKQNAVIQVSPLVVSFTLNLATLGVQSHYELLLQLAGTLRDDKLYPISIVVVHMACEACTELALSRAFNSRGVSDLEHAITKFMNGYNLANPRNRDLYNALTGRTIQNQPFWNQFWTFAKSGKS
jgi:hypothetical protein